MQCVIWNDRFEVGIKIIDEQHKGLVDTMNKLCDSLDQGTEKNVINEVLKELSAFAVSHFGTEEKYFKEFNYEKTEEHIAEHNKFKEKIESLKKDCDEQSCTNVSTEIMAYLGDWFADHVLKHDKEYVATFREHGLS